MTEESLTRRTSASVIWMTAQKWVTRIGGLVTMIVLTRTLAPEDFGVAAAATTLMPLLYVLADVGFSSYIVQAESPDRRTLSTAFWFSLTSGLVLGGLVAGGAPIIGQILNLPDVVPLLQMMAVSVLVIAVASVPMSLMRRRLAFRSLALMEVTGALVAQVVAVVAALQGAGAWALVLQTMVSQVIATVWVWMAAKWRPRLEFSRERFAAMGAFGLNVLGSEIVVVGRYWAETAVVISGLGVREMGYLNIAQRLVQSAQDLSVSALLPVSMAAFAKVRDDPPRLRSSYLRASSISHAVVSPMMVFVAVAAPILVPFLFGADKQGSAVGVPALAIIAVLNVGWAIDQGLHIGMGRPGRWLALIAGAQTITVVILAYAVHFGLAALLLAWIAGAAIEALIRWLAVGPLVGAPLRHMALPLLGVAPPAAIAAAAGLGLLQLLGGTPDLLQLALVGVAVLLCFLVALRFLRRDTFVDAVGVLPGRLARMFRWALPRQQKLADESA